MKKTFLSLLLIVGSFSFFAGSVFAQERFSKKDYNTTTPPPGGHRDIKKEREFDTRSSFQIEYRLSDESIAKGDTIYMPYLVILQQEKKPVQSVKISSLRSLDGFVQSTAVYKKEQFLNNQNNEKKIIIRLGEEIVINGDTEFKVVLTYINNSKSLPLPLKISE